MILPEAFSWRAFLPSFVAVATRDPFFLSGSKGISLLRRIGSSPSTMAVPSFGLTERTVPVLPASLPWVTMTVSFLRILAMLMSSPSDDFRCERKDLHVVLVAELARHGPENT